jgi:hypothetical protein
MTLSKTTLSVITLGTMTPSTATLSIISMITVASVGQFYYMKLRNTTLSIKTASIIERILQL